MDNPFEVVTILLGNSDSVNVNKYIAPIQNSGIAPFLYEPPKVPMGVEDWPTLSQMIGSGKRVVMFMDYRADQKRVPYILDEFSQLWETPFSPTDPTFPCTIHRPTHLSVQQASQRLYMANHNLNFEIKFGDLSVLVPNLLAIHKTNGVKGFSSLGTAAETCKSKSRQTNFLLARK